MKCKTVAKPTTGMSEVGIKPVIFLIFKHQQSTSIFCIEFNFKTITSTPHCLCDSNYTCCKYENKKQKMYVSICNYFYFTQFVIIVIDGNNFILFEK